MSLAARLSASFFLTSSKGFACPDENEQEEALKY